MWEMTEAHLDDYKDEDFTDRGIPSPIDTLLVLQL